MGRDENPTDFDRRAEEEGEKIFGERVFGLREGGRKKIKKFEKLIDANGEKKVACSMGRKIPHFLRRTSMLGGKRKSSKVYQDKTEHY